MEMIILYGNDYFIRQVSLNILLSSVFYVNSYHRNNVRNISSILGACLVTYEKAIQRMTRHYF